MKRTISALSLVVGFLTLPLSAGATPTAWLLNGTIDSVFWDANLNGAGPPHPINPGDLFRFVLHFDTATPFSNPSPCATNSGGQGTRCFHNGDPTQYISDVVIGGFAYGDFLPTSPANNQIIVRNEFPNAAGIPEDGYAFISQKVYQGGDFTQFFVNFRGPPPPEVVTDGRVLPLNPPLNLLGLANRNFQVCDHNGAGANGNCDYLEVNGTFTSVARVPEPGSLALLAIGLAGFATSRRSRAK